MTRIQADLALLLAGSIWGFGFVAQKTALDHIGPFTFVASRFLISALFVLPFVLHERGFQRLYAGMNRKNASRILLLCGTFAPAVLLQQYGMKVASVTHTAFLTGLYIVMVPFLGRIFHRQVLSPTTLIASFLSVLGIWLLSGGDINDVSVDFRHGDGLVLLCTFSFAAQVVIIGRLAKRLMLPFTLSMLQYLAVGLTALIAALLFEEIHVQDLLQAWIPILFAGIASGGIAYTLQAVAQQHTPSTDAAIIMSSEALFGGVGGVWLMHDKLSFAGICGCIAIIGAIIIVELGPMVKNHRSKQAAVKT